jgi:hypothetical protein
MADYQRQMAMLAEELRKLKKATGVDSAPGESVGPSEAGAPPQTASASDPLCSKCQRKVAYDMPMRSLLQVMTGEAKVGLADMFTVPGGRVKANSPLKKLVECGGCIEGDATRLVVCASGGAGNRLTCDWCRTRMTTSTTDYGSGWCGKKHSNCRGLCIENETDRQGNTHFLNKGLTPVRETVPWDEVKLIDTGLAEAWNDADYVIVARSSLGKALVILEIDNREHAGGGQYTPEKEQEKNDGNFKAGQGFDKILFIRINPSGQYATLEGTVNTDKRARWLIMRDWIVTFLRFPYGSWAWGDKTLTYLFYSHDSALIDRRPSEFMTVVACQAPALPESSSLADWACCLDPYLPIKGSATAQEALEINKRMKCQPESEMS